MKTYIGVDLGGTNVRVAKVDETGAILQIVKEPTEIGKGVEQVVSKIISMIERIEGYEAVAGRHGCAGSCRHEKRQDDSGYQSAGI